MRSFPPSSSPAAGAPDPEQAILRGIAEARVDDAVAARSRAHWLARQAEDEATLVGALCDLAEQQVPVQVRVHGGHALGGVVAAAGPDALVLADGPASWTLVRTAHLVLLRSEPGRTEVPTPRLRTTPTSGPDFVERLRDLAVERSAVVVHTTDGDVIPGQLRAVGRDVVTVQAAGGSRAPVLVALGAIAAVGGTGTLASAAP
jgi:hypothetical protein